VGEWSEELEFEDQNVSSTSHARSAYLFDSAFNSHYHA